MKYFLLSIFFVGGMMSQVLATEKKQEARIEIRELKVSLEIGIKKKNTTESYKFLGAESCQQTVFNGAAIEAAVTCLKFATPFKEDNPAFVPVFLLSKSVEGVGRQLQDMYQQKDINFLPQENAEEYPWGTLEHLRTNTMGSASYYILKPEDSDNMIVIGPAADIVLKEFEVGFSVV